jgi:hypothetical protein
MKSMMVMMMPMMTMMIDAYDDYVIYAYDDYDNAYDDDDGFVLITGRILHSVLGRCLLSLHHL